MANGSLAFVTFRLMCVLNLSVLNESHAFSSYFVSQIVFSLKLIMVWGSYGSGGFLIKTYLTFSNIKQRVLWVSPLGLEGCLIICCVYRLID